jgi:hypothetical protein
VKKTLAKFAAGGFGAAFGVMLALGLAFAAAPQYYQTGVLFLTSLIGTEHVSVDNGGPMSTVATTAALDSLVISPTVVTANSSTSSATLTAANMTGVYGSVILPMSGTLTAAANATLIDVPTLVANYPGAKVTVGQSFLFVLVNESAGAFSWTVLTNTGWTLNSGVGGVSYVVPQNTYTTFVVQFTSQTTATITPVATGFYTG